MRIIALILSPLSLFAANILVTGGAGYIGSQTCKALKEAGHTPITYDNLCHGHKHAVRFGPLVVGDLTDTQSLIEAMKKHEIDAVVHLAAYTDVGESVRDPRLYYKNNTVGTYHLLEAMMEAQVRHIVFASTCAVYGNPPFLQAPCFSRELTFNDISLNESNPLNPLSPYAWSKLMCEKMIEGYSDAYGICYVNFRFFNAAGADLNAELGEEHEPANHLIPIVFEVAEKKRDCVKVFGQRYPTWDGTGVRDYISVVDLARAHVLAVNHLLDHIDRMTLNLGTGQGYSVIDVIDAVEKVSGEPIERKFVEEREGDPAILIANPSQAYDRLDWRAEHSDLLNMIQTEWNWRQTADVHEE